MYNQKNLSSYPKNNWIPHQETKAIQPHLNQQIIQEIKRPIYDKTDQVYLPPKMLGPQEDPIVEKQCSGYWCAIPALIGLSLLLLGVLFALGVIGKGYTTPTFDQKTVIPEPTPNNIWNQIKPEETDYQNIPLTKQDEQRYIRDIKKIVTTNQNLLIENFKQIPKQCLQRNKYDPNTLSVILSDQEKKQLKSFDQWKKYQYKLYQKLQDFYITFIQFDQTMMIMGDTNLLMIDNTALGYSGLLIHKQQTPTSPNQNININCYIQFNRTQNNLIEKKLEILTQQIRLRQIQLNSPIVIPIKSFLKTQAQKQLLKSKDDWKKYSIKLHQYNFVLNFKQKLKETQSNIKKYKELCTRQKQAKLPQSPIKTPLQESKLKSFDQMRSYYNNLRKYQKQVETCKDTPVEAPTQLHRLTPISQRKYI